MRYSKMLIPTLKEIPAEAEVISHTLMLRAGLIRKLAAGIYSLLPLGLSVTKKVEDIIREEMNRSGAQEVLLPTVQPAELWKESGRWEEYGKELLRFKDRHQREFCFGPTHEEVITDLIRKEIRSYRQLPLNLYQIQTKFRDEIRPRFGIMRGREFIMKDAYSFDCDETGADESYKKMYDTYCRIFERCGLRFKAVEAETGIIGGSFSHEFMVLADSGEEGVVFCNGCDYAANIDRAEIRIEEKGNEGEKKKMMMMKEIKKVNTPGRKTVEEVSRYLKVSPQDLVKTLIFETENGIIAGLVRGDHQINETKLKRFLDSNIMVLAGDETVKEVTGAPSGFAGPVDLNIAIFADQGVKGMQNFITGANEIDAHNINVNIGRDFEIKGYGDIRNVREDDKCPRCGKDIDIKRGIEVGHIFKLGTRYSQILRATYIDSKGKEQLIIMGCYGIGVGRTISAAIEQNHDENGIIWPMPIAPFQVFILPVDTKDTTVMERSEKIYNSLLDKKIDVLIDDRDDRPGVKFKDADLIGIPIQVIIGLKNLREGNIEIKIRRNGEILKWRVDTVIDKIMELI
ncbi:MAG: proline--tRNA ligase [Nitrospinae bacterium]|nr:proline--tRNA ligase [Nitrospinota bacterium]